MDAIQIAQENSCELNPYEEDLSIDFVCANVLDLVDKEDGTCRLTSEIVVTNPPFGTRAKGIDMDFLSVASSIATDAIYSLHKTSTRAHVQKHAEKTLGLASARVVAELRYDLPKTYKFHKKQCLDIAVDFWRFEVAK